MVVSTTTIGSAGSPPTLSFAPVSGAPGLYALPPELGRPVAVYFLAAQAAAPSSPLTLQESWDAVTGWYVLAEGPIPTGKAADFAVAARKALPNLIFGKPPPTGQASGHGVIWATAAQIAAPSTLGQTKALIAGFTGSAWSVQTTVAFEWSPLEVDIQSSAPIAPDPSGQFIELNLLSFTGSFLTISYGSLRNVLVQAPNPWVLTIPLTGPEAGALQFPVGLDSNTLIPALGCEICFFGGPSQLPLAYPLLPYTPGALSNFCAFDVSLHPLFPLSPELSRFQLDFIVSPHNAAALASPYFLGPDGQGLVAKPCQNPPAGAKAPGFAFCQGIWTPSGSYYLAPQGAWTLSDAGSPPASLELMPGLFEREFLRLSPDDLIEFTPGEPAWAPGFGVAPAGSSPEGSPSPALVGPLTTSWIQVLPVGADPARGYFSQPSASPYFGEIGEAFPGSVDAYLGDLAAPLPVPVGLYGGVGAASTGSPTQPPELYAAFEAQVLAALRHKTLSTTLNGPVIVDPYAKAALAAGASPPAGPSTAVTPQGLVVELTPEGLWSKVVLAVSPQQDSPVQPLSFDGAGSPPLVQPALSALLTRNELFLVMSRRDPLYPFENRLTLGGFDFVFDIPEGGSPLDDGTILVFKYNSKVALQDLVAQPSLWADPSLFNEDAAATSAALQAAIATARAEADAPGKPFAYFEQIASDPSWTGLIAFNVRIDGSNMPLDLQMLLGGINGQLRAHHFGVESNHLAREGVPPHTVITESSLFGVIFYENLASATPSPSPSLSPTLDYEVETLIVVFENSTITEFDVEVGVTMNAMFGRDVSLLDPGSPGAPPNTLRIKGQYQSRGGVGAVTFVTDTPFTFAFVADAKTGPRVLESLLVTQASLTPVGSTREGSPPSSQLVSAAFAMSGELYFTTAPFPNADELDLFSYGTSQGGLAFTGLTVSIAFELGPDGAMTPGTKQLAFKPELMQPAPSPQTIRPNSLLYSLPLQFSRFQTTPKGLTQSATGATPVHILELESGALGAGSPASPALEPTGQTSPWSTTSPLYALEFDLSLGSLGALSSVHGDISAKLLLGWGPSPTIPDADAAAVMVQLPQLSAGYQGFNLQGLLKTTFGDANLLKVDLPGGDTVYAMALNNVQFSLFGFTFPPGIMADFLLFSGTSGGTDKPYAGNLAWYLAVTEAG